MLTYQVQNLKRQYNNTSLLHLDLYLIGKWTVADRRISEHPESVGPIGHHVSNCGQSAALDDVHSP